MEEKRGELQHIFYLYLHSKLVEASTDGYLTTHEANWRLFQWKIPDCIKPLVLKELEILGLIKLENKNLIKIGESKFNIEYLYPYCKKLGIY